MSVEAIERWFNLELKVDPRLQVLTVVSSEPLPFQLWRERMLAKYRYRPGGRSDADVIVPDEYHWATLPLVDPTRSSRASAPVSWSAWASDPTFAWSETRASSMGA